MKKIMFLTIVSVLFGCAQKENEDPVLKLSELLEKNPQILVNAIEKNPEAVMGAIQKAAQQSQAKMQENQAKQEMAKLDQEFENPLKPEIDPSRAVLGNVEAPIIIVEYTDFQCPYCARGYATVEEVRKIYGDKVKVLVKNLPLPMHPLARQASQMFEAIKLQDPQKAWAFYNEIFQNQSNLKSEKYLDDLTKKVGANLAKAKKDSQSEKVLSLIQKDEEEARKFNFSGTPAFIVNGVSIRGAYPVDHFRKIIDKHLKK